MRGNFTQDQNWPHTEEKVTAMIQAIKVTPCVNFVKLDMLIMMNYFDI